MSIDEHQEEANMPGRLQRLRGKTSPEFIERTMKIFGGAILETAFQLGLISEANYHDWLYYIQKGQDQYGSTWRLRVERQFLQDYPRVVVYADVGQVELNGEAQIRKLIEVAIAQGIDEDWILVEMLLITNTEWEPCPKKPEPPDEKTEDRKRYNGLMESFVRRDSTDELKDDGSSARIFAEAVLVTSGEQTQAIGEKQKFFIEVDRYGIHVILELPEQACGTLAKCPSAGLFFTISSTEPDPDTAERIIALAREEFGISLPKLSFAGVRYSLGKKDFRRLKAEAISKCIDEEWLESFFQLVVDKMVPPMTLSEMKFADFNRFFELMCEFEKRGGEDETVKNQRNIGILAEAILSVCATEDCGRAAGASIKVYRDGIHLITATNRYTLGGKDFERLKTEAICRGIDQEWLESFFTSVVDKIIA